MRKNSPDQQMQSSDETVDLVKEMRLWNT